nr:pyridoxal-phosphate dependent enzyme [Gemmatimonadaceae bacterium]
MRRFPGLAALPRASFVEGPTPVEQSSAAPGLWVKRDDLSSKTFGGNKVRALDFLLGGIAMGERIVTVGARGSTHALATALHASTLGATTTVFRWPQELNEAARRVDRRLRETAAVHDASTPLTAMLRALAYRASHQVRWIPAGGTSPLGIIGHVDAALELAGQVGAGAMPTPARVVLPLGTGGTAAGLVIGFALAGLDAEIVGVQVVPRIVANRWRVGRLVARTCRFMTEVSGEPIRPPDLGRFSIERAYYGGAYGRETPAGRDADACYRAAHPGAMLDATYTAKA